MNLARLDHADEAAEDRLVRQVDLRAIQDVGHDDLDLDGRLSCDCGASLFETALLANEPREGGEDYHFVPMGNCALLLKAMGASGVAPGLLSWRRPISQPAPLRAERLPRTCDGDRQDCPPTPSCFPSPGLCRTGWGVSLGPFSWHSVALCAEERHLAH